MIFKDSQWMSLWFQGLNCSWNHEGVSFKILSSTQIKFLYINFYLQFMKQLYLDTRVAHTDLGVFWGSNPGLDFPWRSDMDPIFLEVGSGSGLTLTRNAILLDLSRNISIILTSIPNVKSWSWIWVDFLQSDPVFA